MYVNLTGQVRRLIKNHGHKEVGPIFEWASTKIGQPVLLCWTKWPPELRIEEKPLENFF